MRFLSRLLSRLGNPSHVGSDRAARKTLHREGRRGAGEEDASSGQRVLDAGLDDEELVAGVEADLILGGADIDTADYSGAPAGVGVDLTITHPQDTGGAGIDTLTGVRRVRGSTHNDTFAFSTVRAGGHYAVDGLEGFNAIDLRCFARAEVDVDLERQTLSIDLGSGQRATILFQCIHRLFFRDATPTDAPRVIVESDIDERGTGELRAMIVGGDGLEPAYRWTQLTGPPVVIHHPASPETTFTPPQTAGDHALTFRLDITDGDASSSALTTVCSGHGARSQPASDWRQVRRAADH